MTRKMKRAALALAAALLCGSALWRLLAVPVLLGLVGA